MDTASNEGSPEQVAVEGRNEALLRRAALDVSAAGGPRVFEQLAARLAELLGVRSCLVALLAPDGRSARTLASWHDGSPAGNFAFDARMLCGGDGRRGFCVGERLRCADSATGTPLAMAGLGFHAVHPLLDATGEPIGLLATLDDGPLDDERLAATVMNIFASRIVAEIERDRADEALRNAALAVSGAAGDAVHAELCRYLATMLDVDMAFVAEYRAERPDTLQTLAVWCDGEPRPNFEYSAAGTPCETIVGQMFRAYPVGLREAFPEDADFAEMGMESYAGYPLVDAGGAPLGLVAVVSRLPLAGIDRIESILQIFAVRAAAEISRTRAERSLRVSEASYRALLEAIDDAIFIHDWDTGAIIDVNPRACETYGYTAEEMRCLRMGDLSAGVEPYTEARALEHINAAKLGRRVQIEWHRRNRDGSLTWDEVRIRRATIGGEDRVVAFTRDITDRRQREEEIRRSEARLRAMLEASIDAVIGMDADGMIVEFNPAAERMFGHAREAAIGRRMAELIIPPRYRRAHAAGLARYLASGSGPVLGRRVEMQALRADGTEFPVELAIGVAASRDTGGRGDIFIGFLRDITDRREAEAERERLEAQLRQAQKMEAIGHLAGGIAHDFNNILTGVMGFLTLGRERADALGDPRLGRHLAQAEAAATRARDLIRQMLTFSRGEGSRKEAHELAPLLRESGRLLRSTLPASIALRIAVDRSVPPVRVNPVQIEQILLNLCINARDALEGTGEIRLSLEAARFAPPRLAICASCRESVHGGFVELRVEDDGPGIPAGMLDRLFEPFFTTKEVGRGSGMGLPVVHGLVHEHGGHLLVEPGAESTGARFRVLLPPADAATTDARGQGRRPASGAAGPWLRGRILLVEDEAVVAAFMRELLDAWGLEVFHEADPIEALRRFAADPAAFDLLLTDQTMPGLSGLELAARLSSMRPGLPIVLYTGFGQDIAEERLAAAGVSSVLAKPVDQVALRDALAAHLASADA